MKYHRMLFSLLLFPVLLVNLSACGKQQEQITETASKKQSVTYQVGICQINSDSFSNTIVQGFQTALTTKLKSDQITFLSKNAQGDTATLTSQYSEADQQGLDLIFIANTGNALSLDTTGYKTPTMITPEFNVTELVEDTLVQLIPDIQQLGILYDSTDPTAASRVKQMMQYLDADEINYQEYPATDSASLCSGANDICDQCDSVYVPSNQLTLDNIQKLENIFLPAGIPLISDNEELGSIGIAAVTLQSYDVGYQMGEAAAEVLQNGTSPDSLSIDPSGLIQKYYNRQICEDFAIEVPADLIELPVTD